MVTTETPRAVLLTEKYPWFSKATWWQIKEYAPTFLTEFVVMASQIIVYKLAAHLLAKQGFSEYALARRTISLLFPIPVLGLSIGLPRYISYSNGRNDPESANRYFAATLKCAGIASMLCLVLINTFPGIFASVFFGSQGYHQLAFPISLMILGLCEHTVACGYFRGYMQLNRANTLQILNLGLLPVLVFFLAPHSLPSVLTAFGLASIVTSSVALCFTPLAAVWENSWVEMKELLRYGVQRVPGDFFLMALFTLPATIVAHIYGIEQAGFVAFGISVVSMIGAIFAPVGLVLLPKATAMLADGNCANLRAHVRSIVRITLGSSSAIIFVAWIAIPTVMRLYLGNGFEQVAFFARVLLLATFPYCLYLVVRNLVDAYHESGVTAAILGAGLGFFLAAVYVTRLLGSNITMILVNFVLATYVITLLSGWECWRILRSQPRKDFSPTGLYKLF